MRDEERRKAADLFGTEDEPSALATQIKSKKSAGFVVPTFTNGDDDHHRDRIYTEEEKSKMRAAIKNATTLTEMLKLEKDMAEGRIPAHVLEGVEPMEV